MFVGLWHKAWAPGTCARLPRPRVPLLLHSVAVSQLTLPACSGAPPRVLLGV